MRLAMLPMLWKVSVLLMPSHLGASMSKRLERSSKGEPMNTHAEARELLWAAVPSRIGDNRKSWLARAARTMGWGERRTKALFYCEARCVTADEWRQLNMRLDQLKAAERRHGERINELRMAYSVAGARVPVDGGKTVSAGDEAPAAGITGLRAHDEA